MVLALEATSRRDFIVELKSRFDLKQDSSTSRTPLLVVVCLFCWALGRQNGGQAEYTTASPLLLFVSFGLFFGLRFWQLFYFFIFLFGIPY